MARMIQIRHVPEALRSARRAAADAGRAPGRSARAPGADRVGRIVSRRSGLRRALGREPRDFAGYASETAAAGVWGEQR